MVETQAQKFVDDTAVFRRLGEESAAQFGVTRASIAAQIVGLEATLLTGPGKYGKMVSFPDGSDIAQVRGTRRWEVWG